MDVLARETVFGRTIKLHGELVGAENVVIEGDFEGIVRLEGSRLTVGPQARVRAGIVAHELIVYGRVEGEIHATGSASFRAEAVVIGDVYAARLSMEEGTVLRGNVDPGRAGDPLPAVSLSWTPAGRAGMEPSPVAARAGLAAATRQWNGTGVSDDHTHDGVAETLFESEA